MSGLDSREMSENRDLERRLEAWQPGTDGLSRERMLFAAGRASVTKESGTRALGIHGLAAALAVACVGMGVAWQVERGRVGQLESQWAARTDSPDETRIAANERPRPLPIPTPPDPSSYLALMHRFERMSERGGVTLQHKDIAPQTERTERPLPSREPLRVRGWQDSTLVL